MKFSRILIAGAAGSVFATALLAQQPAAGTAASAAPAAAAQQYSETELLETYGWVLGRRLGFAEMGYTPEQVEAISRGMSRAAKGEESLVNLDEIGGSLDAFLQGKQQAYLAKAEAKAKAEAEEFFTKLKENPNVVALPSGLHYEIVQPGTGAYPKASDTVRVHYVGKLLDGTTFDSSVERGQPAEFPLSGVIKGWTEGMQKINAGGKIKLYVPGDLAYGPRPPQGSQIPPNATLVFDVELLEVKPAAGAAAPAAAPKAP